TYPTLVRFTELPLVTIRKTAVKNALREMEWFLSGSSNINDLHPSVRPWWTPWVDKDGEIKNNYSRQFRKYGGTLDQISTLIEGMKSHPYSTRNLVTTWNSIEMIDPDTPITNCHGTVIQTTGYPSMRDS